MENSDPTFRAATAFDQTRQRVLQNSRTALRQSAQAGVSGADPQSRSHAQRRPALGTGVVLEAGARLVNALTNGAINENRMRVARDAAEMLVAQGHARDNVAQALFAVSQRQQLSRNARRAIARLALQVAEGTRQKTIEAAGPERSPPMPPMPAGGSTLLSLPQPPTYMPPAR